MPNATIGRADLLRTACCQLGEWEAGRVHDVFAGREGQFGQRSGELSTPTRCDLLALLENRTGVIQAKEAAQKAEADRRDQRAAQGWQRADEARKQQDEPTIRSSERQDSEDPRPPPKTDEERWQRDKELHDKAGKITWFDIVVPTFAEGYRIPYADRIHDPVWKGARVPPSAARPCRWLERRSTRSRDR